MVCVPLNLGWRADEIAYVLDHSGSRGIVVEAQLLPAVLPGVEKVPAVRDVVVAPGTGAPWEHTLPDRTWLPFDALAEAPDTEPEFFVDERDAISYLYTSGTTSFPKGVVGSHVAIYLETLMVAAETGIGAGDRIACLMPLFHTAQLNGFATPAVTMGATQYLLRGFDPDALLELIETERIDRMFALPMMYRALVERDDIGRARPVVAADGRLRDGADARRVAAHLPRRVRLRLLPGVRPDRDEPGDDVLPARAPALARRRGGHAGAQRADRDHVARRRAAAARRGGRDRLPRPAGAQRLPEEPRGDRGRIRRTAGSTPATWAASTRTACSGSATATRTSSRPAGENVASIEVEKAVYAASPDVAEAVIVGLPHERWSEAITAVVVPKPGATPRRRRPARPRCARTSTRTRSRSR